MGVEGNNLIGIFKKKQKLASDAFAAKHTEAWEEILEGCGW